MRAAEDQNQWNAKPDNVGRLARTTDGNNRQAAIRQDHDNPAAFSGCDRGKSMCTPIAAPVILGRST